MKATATGSFEVKLLPQTDERTIPLFGRMTIDKEFTGDLTATSQGQMLSSGNPAQGSAGYVAIERVEGTLHGKRGSFALQHNATMHKGENALQVIVIPGSGTDDLQGLSGTFTILREDKKHKYAFNYELEE